jgi:hypothetical protein
LAALWDFFYERKKQQSDTPVSARDLVRTNSEGGAEALANGEGAKEIKEAKEKEEKKSQTLLQVAMTNEGLFPCRKEHCTAPV